MNTLFFHGHGSTKINHPKRKDWSTCGVPWKHISIIHEKASTAKARTLTAFESKPIQRLSLYCNQQKQPPVPGIVGEPHNLEMVKLVHDLEQKITVGVTPEVTPFSPESPIFLLTQRRRPCNRSKCLFFICTIKIYIHGNKSNCTGKLMMKSMYFATPAVYLAVPFSVL